MTIEEARVINPGHWVLPTDEEFAARVADVEAQAEAKRAEEAEATAKAERIAALEAELASLKDETLAQG